MSNAITTQVNKANYEVFQFNGGHFAISEIGTYGGADVYGGDSACEDHYNEEHIREVFEQWNGTLVDGRIEA